MLCMKYVLQIVGVRKRVFMLLGECESDPAVHTLRPSRIIQGVKKTTNSPSLTQEECWWKLQHHSGEWAVGGAGFDESRTFCSQRKWLLACSWKEHLFRGAAVLGRQTSVIWSHLGLKLTQRRKAESKVILRGCRRWWCGQCWVVKLVYSAWIE